MSAMKIRKAVSEMLASLILIMIVGSVGTLLYGYSLEVSQKQQEVITTQYQDSSNALIEKLAIIDVWFDQSDDTLDITVYNYGEIQTKIEAVYINGNPVTSYASELDASILVQRLGRVTFTSPIDISPDETIKVIIITNRGNSVETTWKI